MKELKDVFDKLEEVSQQSVVILGSIDLLINEVRNAASRLASLEGRVAELESERPAPAFRAPQPSLTSEERREQTESIRAAVDAQTPYLAKQTKLQKTQTWLQPAATFVGIVAATFVATLAHSCAGGGHSTHERDHQDAPVVEAVPGHHDGDRGSLGIRPGG